MPLARFRKALKAVDSSAVNAKIAEKMIDNICYMFAFCVGAKLIGLWGPLAVFIDGPLTDFVNHHGWPLLYTLLVAMCLYPLFSVFADAGRAFFNELFNRPTTPSEAK